MFTREYSASIGDRDSRNYFGVSKARVTISGGNLVQTIQVTTKPFGYYQFPNVDVDQTYTLSVAAKGLSFAQSTQKIALEQILFDINFEAN